MPSTTCSRLRASRRRRSTRATASHGCCAGSSGAPGRREADAAGNLIWRFDEARRACWCSRTSTPCSRASCRTSPVRDGERVLGPGVGDNAAAVVCAVRVDRAAGARARAGGACRRVHRRRGGPRQPRGRASRLRRLQPEAGARAGGPRPHARGRGCRRQPARAHRRARAREATPGPTAGARARSTSSAASRARSASPPKRDASTNIGRIEGGTADQRDRGARRARDRAAGARGGRAHALRAHARAALRRASARARDRDLGRPPGRPPRPPAAAARDRPRACASALGLPDELVAASTDANAALAAGIPALCIGCALGGEMHTPEEYVEIASLAQGRQQLRGVLVQALLRTIPTCDSSAASARPARRGRDRARRRLRARRARAGGAGALHQRRAREPDKAQLAAWRAGGAAPPREAELVVLAGGVTHEAVVSARGGRAR